MGFERCADRVLDRTCNRIVDENLKTRCERWAKTAGNVQNKVNLGICLCSNIENSTREERWTMALIVS